MKKIIRLTERDLTRLVRRTIMEMDGRYSIGHANYQDDWDKHNEEMRQLADERKYHVPDYNPRSGRGWNDETIREYVYETFGAELPDDFDYRIDDVSEWLEENGYQRLK